VTDTADVVVVGGGIVGASIGFQIARRSDLRVVVLDKGAGPAEGSTGASSSICRCRYTHPQVVRLALHGQRAYREWPAFTGLADPVNRYVRTGVAWIFDEDPAGVGADAARLAGQGVAVSVLDPEGLAARYPALSACVAPFDLTGEVEHECRPFRTVLVEDDGGYADPAGADADLLEALRREGGEVRFRAAVGGVRHSAGRVIGVDLAGGEGIDAGLVINAAGPWCNRLNALAGADLAWTLEPTRVQVAYRDWPADLGPLPVGADSSTGIYFRPDANGARVLFGSVLPEDEEEVVADPDDYNRAADASFRDLKVHALHHRVPGLAHRGGVTGIAGLYTINRQDVHPVVGPSGVEGWWVANGFSGHGFKLAPMIGSMVAKAITGTEAEYDTDVPMSLFAVDREPIVVGTKAVLA
jgi:glycine/D-amino acid oxidase-like deaminating enzyme